jgi:hypothetical protein
MVRGGSVGAHGSKPVAVCHDYVRSRAPAALTESTARGSRMKVSGFDLAIKVSAYSRRLREQCMMLVPPLPITVPPSAS